MDGQSHGLGVGVKLYQWVGVARKVGGALGQSLPSGGSELTSQLLLVCELPVPFSLNTGLGHTFPAVLGWVLNVDKSRLRKLSS